MRRAARGGYSRAYLRHLYLAGEILVLRLLSLHNLHFYGELVAGARAAIEAGRFGAWAERHRRGHGALSGASAVLCPIPRPRSLGATQRPCPATRRSRSARSCSSASSSRSRSSTRRSRAQRHVARRPRRSRRARRRRRGRRDRRRSARSPSSTAFPASISRRSRSCSSTSISSRARSPRRTASCRCSCATIASSSRWRTRATSTSSTSSSSSPARRSTRTSRSRRHAPQDASPAAYDAKERGEAHYLGPRRPARDAAAARARAGADAAASASAEPTTAPAERRAGARRRRRSGGDGRRARPSSSTERVRDASATKSRSVETLPDGHAPARVAGGRGHRAPATAKLVLVVDDEEDIRKLLRRLLDAEGLPRDRGRSRPPRAAPREGPRPGPHHPRRDAARAPRLRHRAAHQGEREVRSHPDRHDERGLPRLAHRRGPQGRTTASRSTSRSRSASRTCSRRSRACCRSRSEPGAAARDPEHLSEDAEKALREGIAAYKSGQIDAAIDAPEAGRRDRPARVPPPLSPRAFSTGKKGQIYDGIQELERAVDLNPKHFPALKNLAVLYEKAGFKNKAIEMWERGVDWRRTSRRAPPSRSTCRSSFERPPQIGLPVAPSSCSILEVPPMAGPRAPRTSKTSLRLRDRPLPLGRASRNDAPFLANVALVI